MNKDVFFIFLVLSTVLAANVAAEWLLMNTIFFRFYHRANNSEINTIDTSLENARDIVPLLDKSQTTVIYIHGYLEDVEMDNVRTVTKALLNSTSVNVCSIDYRQIARIYLQSVAYVPQIGAALAAAINGMVEAGLDGAKLHLIGFSLGAQICAYTARNTTMKVPRITGLDPAGPLFIRGYLTKDDASYVFILHTDIGGYGMWHMSGHVDFKPNLGYRIQRGCGTEAIETLVPPDVCSHLRAWQFFAESILNSNAFPSVKCTTDYQFENGTCDTSSIIPMGYHTPNNVTGVYYCQTNSNSPYSMGQPGTVYNDYLL